MFEVERCKGPLETFQLELKFAVSHIASRIRKEDEKETSGIEIYPSFVIRELIASNDSRIVHYIPRVKKECFLQGKNYKRGKSVSNFPSI